MHIADQGVTILDTRTPAEYAQGHIPNAINMPLFSNEERVEIGTIYKQVSKQAAILRGLELVGPKMNSIAKESIAHSKNNSIALHCWRGGMRSGSVAWLLNTAGIENIYVLEGGYKSFRTEVLSSFEIPFYKVLISGKTGSGKTRILQALSQKGAQILDLEKLACHKGSAFGSINEPKQPTNEQFENQIYYDFRQLNRSDIIWIEDESRNIGSIKIPDQLFNEIRKGKIIFITIPDEERIKILIDEYAHSGDDLLAESIHKISKKLGGLNTNNCLKALSNKDYKQVAEILLIHYYDKLYLDLIEKRKDLLLQKFDYSNGDPMEIASSILKFIEEEKLQNQNINSHLHF